MEDEHLKPCLVQLEEGKKYAWCSCGKSRTQPFCDGSHKGSKKAPFVYKAQKTEEVLLCNCKATKFPPFCDGSHNNLDDGYAEATPEEIVKFSNAIEIERDKLCKKSLLDGGAYVLTPNIKKAGSLAGLLVQQVITQKYGAHHLSLHLLSIKKGLTKPLCSKNSDVVLFIVSGEGTVNISGRSFAIGPEMGLFVKANEAIQFETKAKLDVFAAICPQGELTVSKSPTSFYEKYPDRLEKVDHKKATVMADRFFQILVGEEIGSKEVTQFLGEVPKSRAAMHQHLYEEAIVILSGSGTMWTETKKTSVNVGDVIFLPKRQAHSLECKSEDGLRLMGVFYPSGSPAINY